MFAMKRSCSYGTQNAAAEKSVYTAVRRYERNLMVAVLFVRAAFYDVGVLIGKHSRFDLSTMTAVGGGGSGIGRDHLLMCNQFDLSDT